MSTTLITHRLLDIHAAIGHAPPYTWEELAEWRWGPADGDPTPGIVIDRLGRGNPSSIAEADGGSPRIISIHNIMSREGKTRPPGDDEGLRHLLAKLNRRGIRVDGTLVYPRISVGTLTGRVTYQNPGLQGTPKSDRARRFAPVVAGRVFVRADFGQIEPRILLTILRRRGLVSWDAGEDLYRVLIGDSSVSRDEVKVIVNKLINGGRVDLAATGRLAEFLSATEAYRDSLAGDARAEGYVLTLAGRRIAIGVAEPNFRGKAVNRVVQGTAADIFNRAAVAVDAAIAENRLPAAVAFLLFDELWVEADPGDERIVPLVRAAMEAAALADEVLVPVKFAEIGHPDLGSPHVAREPLPSYEAIEPEEDPGVGP
jgi:hypothetical protein